MKREDRLKEIEKVWNRYYRSDYFDGVVRWEDIQWKPFAIKGTVHDGIKMCDWETIAKRGHFMYIWGEYEEASGWIEWDWALLRALYTWYILPEECNAPLFINEAARAICIPNVWWAHDLTNLFQHPESMLLGMEHIEAELAAEKAEIAVALFQNNATRAFYEYTDGPRPIMKSEALAWLNK